ncbi:MAG: ABC transporter ATP-binding protein [Pseudomonadota bacterium]
MTNALEIKNLQKTYANNFVALHGIDLTIKKGEFFGLLGPNGAGKSTTIGIITSIVNKTAGKVFVFDHDFDKAPDYAKACIGIVPQEYNFSIFETVIRTLVKQAGYYGIPRKLALERSEKYLKKLGLWEKREDRVRFLSGGQKRRLMIARALVHEPPLLILDEPTAGVDIELRRMMWNFLKEMNAKGTTIILTTHYLEEAEYLCNEIAIINHGRIIEQGLTQDLLRKLNIQTFVLDINKNLSQLPEIKDMNLRLINNKTLEVDIEQGQSINDVFSALSAQAIDVVSLRNKSNRLEELFLKLTQAPESKHV